MGPEVVLIGVCCIYPVVFFAIPAYLAGRYRIRFRMPIEASEREERRPQGYAPRQR